MPTSPDTSEPRTFEGDEIVGSSVKITKAGDGLTDALAIDPVEFHRGEIVYFVLQGKVRYAGFPPEKKDSAGVLRQHIIDTTDIAIVSEEDVAALLQANRDRVKRGLDALATQLRTDDPEDHPFSPDPDNARKCFECGQAKAAQWHTKEVTE